jgi:hypothetical protein
VRAQLAGGGLAIAVGASQVVYLTAMLALGCRLLARALRSGELPETLLSLHFLLCCTLGYLLLGAGLAAAQQDLISSLETTTMVGAGQLFSALGVLAVVCFNWLVFRPNERWARLLVGAFAATFVIGFLGSAASGGFRGYSGDPWYRLLYAGYALAAMWVMGEPIRYFVLMRRRLALGLAEPLLVNRFLLWGVGSICRFAMLAVGSVSALYPQTSLDVATASLVLTGAAILGVGVAACYWLTFFPPAAYVRFVAGPSAG